MARIILIDWNLTTRFLYERTLAEVGHIVSLANSIKDWAMADLILINAYLGGTQVADVIAQLAKSDVEIPTLLLCSSWMGRQIETIWPQGPVIALEGLSGPDALLDQINKILSTPLSKELATANKKKKKQAQEEEVECSTI